MNPKEQKIRWRLILGDEVDEVCGGLDGGAPGLVPGAPPGRVRGHRVS